MNRDILSLCNCFSIALGKMTIHVTLLSRLNAIKALFMMMTAKVVFGRRLTPQEKAGHPGEIAEENLEKWIEWLREGGGQIYAMLAMHQSTPVTFVPPLTFEEVNEFFNSGVDRFEELENNKEEFRKAMITRIVVHQYYHQG